MRSFLQSRVTTSSHEKCLSTTLNGKRSTQIKNTHTTLKSLGIRYVSNTAFVGFLENFWDLVGRGNYLQRKIKKKKMCLYDVRTNLVRVRGKEIFVLYI